MRRAFEKLARRDQKLAAEREAEKKAREGVAAWERDGATDNSSRKFCGSVRAPAALPRPSPTPLCCLLGAARRQAHGGWASGLPCLGAHSAPALNQRRGRDLIFHLQPPGFPDRGRRQRLMLCDVRGDARLGAEDVDQTIGTTCGGWPSRKVFHAQLDAFSRADWHSRPIPISRSARNLGVCRYDRTSRRREVSNAHQAAEASPRGSDAPGEARLLKAPLRPQPDPTSPAPSRQRGTPRAPWQCPDPPAGPRRGAAPVATALGFDCQIVMTSILCCSGSGIISITANRSRRASRSSW